MTEKTEIKKRAGAYSKEKTFTYIKEIMPDGKEFFYNGFIKKVYDDVIIFFDIVLKRDFPVLIESIEIIEPSRKDIEIKTAWEIYKNAR